MSNRKRSSGAATESTGAVHEKFVAARSALHDALIERDEETDLVLTAVLASEHVALVSRPGSAKSLLIDTVARFAGGTAFSVLMNKFTTVDELFGPIDLVALGAGKFTRVTRGYLPEAEFAVLDEVFKASSAILNTLLKLLNERVYSLGDGVWHPAPLRTVMAASNEWPDPEHGGRELDAIFDRFLFRRNARPIVRDDGLRRLLSDDDLTPKIDQPLAPGELDAAQTAVAALRFSDEAGEALYGVFKTLAKEGVDVGDRRKRKSRHAAKAYAWLEGADEVRPEHLDVLQHVAWSDPAEQPAKCREVVMKLCNPVGLSVAELLAEGESILASVDPKNMASMAAGGQKLRDVLAKFDALPLTPKYKKAREHVAARFKALRNSVAESL